MEQDAAEMITAYYEALEASEPLSPFFAESLSTVKVGLSEQLVGYPDVADALAEQTATTTDWRVEDAEPSVTAREEFAWFHDRLTLAWTDTTLDTDYEFDTRWTGTLKWSENTEKWQFVCLHVSAPTADLQNPEDELFSWDD